MTPQRLLGLRQWHPSGRWVPAAAGFKAVASQRPLGRATAGLGPIRYKYLFTTLFSSRIFFRNGSGGTAAAVFSYIIIPEQRLLQSASVYTPYYINIIMGDSQQDSKKRTAYEPWTKKETDLLLKLMVDGARRGWRDNSDIFSKATVEERILIVFNERLGYNRTYSNYQNRLKWFKSRWIGYSNLLKYSSGFGYDHNTKKFTTTDEVWDAYLASHPKDTHLRYGESSDYEDLRIAMGNGVAVGRNSIGLGIAIDANTLGEDENRNARIEDLTFDPENDAFVALSQDDQPPSSFTPPSGQPEVTKSSTQRPKQAKRSRTQYKATSGSSEKIMEEVKTLFGEVHGLLLKRDSELEKREKERSYTTWDAIKEIPNLDADTRIKAFDLFVTNMEHHEILEEEIENEEMEEEIDEEEETEFYENVKLLLLTAKTVLTLLGEIDMMRQRIERALQRRPITRIGYHFVKDMIEGDP
ncbi:hypothetical protein C2S52_016158 [Perilla frutescens var. hirtella]|nr:hypothetical protein C2S52_016158 [Perilla frutescens var. hirtella]